MNRPRVLLAVLVLSLFQGCGRPPASAIAPAFVPYQYVWTNHATDWEFFNVQNNIYLAVANWFDGKSHDVDSVIYDWDGKQFNEALKLPVQGVNGLHGFQINEDRYLAATYYESTYVSLLKWREGRFVESQQLTLPYARDTQELSIGARHFLAVASHYDPAKKTYAVDSKIYEWNGETFVEYQSLPTQGAMRLESFVIAGETYLAIANNFNGTSHNVDSRIYKWDGHAFAEFQSIRTHAAVEWKAFEVGGVKYLAIANNYDDHTHNVDSVIYRWTGASFSEFQRIPTLGAASWEAVSVKGQIFLAVANHYDSNTSSYNTNSAIYKWTGAAFGLIQSVPSHCATRWKQFQIGDRVFLALANAYDGASYRQQSIIFEAGPN